MGINSVRDVTAAAIPTASRGHAHYKFEFRAKGERGDTARVATISVKNIPNEIAAKKDAWKEFARQQNISVHEATQRFTLNRLRF